MRRVRHAWRRRDLRVSFAVMKYVVPGPLLRLLLRPRVVGLDRLAPEGPIIVAPNHLSPFDPFLLSLVSPRRITFLAKREYFEQPGVRGRLMRWLFTSQGQVSTDRGGTLGGISAVQKGVDVVDAGKVFGVFPEGTRGRPGELFRGHTGVAQTSIRTGVPVHPVVITGTYGLTLGKVLRRDVPPMTITVGPPLTPPVSDGRSPRELRHFTNDIMAAIASLGDLQVRETFAPGRQV